MTGVVIVYINFFDFFDVKYFNLVAFGFLVLIFHICGIDGKEAFLCLNSLSLHIGSEVSLKDFSFSQLIAAVKNLFDTEGIPGLVKVLAVLIEQMLIRSGVERPHCKSNELG